MIKLINATKIYRGSSYETTALDNINIIINEGDFLAVMGPSGSGKTTFLNIIGCMDKLTSGKYYFNDIDISNYSSAQLTDIRKNYIGFVFQNFALIQDFTIYENIEIPLKEKNIKKKERKSRMEDTMEMLGIMGLGNKLPSQLSGGQQQRVAIARTLVSGNNIIMADEPTGALDQNTSRELMDIFCKLNKKGKTIIIITHDCKVAEYAKRIVRIEDGKIVK